MTDKSEKRNFDLLDDLRYARIGTSRISPHGKSVVCEVRRNDLDKNISFSELWLIDLISGKTRQLTSDRVMNTSPSWSPDGTRIAFLSDRSGTQQVYLLPIAGGEAMQFTDLKQGAASQPEWSPDGKLIAFTAAVNREPRDPMAPYRVTRTIYRFDGIGYLDDAIQNIFVQSVAGGAPPTADR